MVMVLRLLSWSERASGLEAKNLGMRALISDKKNEGIRRECLINRCWVLDYRWLRLQRPPWVETLVASVNITWGLLQISHHPLLLVQHIKLLHCYWAQRLRSNALWRAKYQWKLWSVWNISWEGGMMWNSEICASSLAWLDAWNLIQHQISIWRDVIPASSMWTI